MRGRGIAGILTFMLQLPLTRKNILPFLVVLAVLLPVYFSTLQTIPNGSEDYYMIDVGETQIVLNRWGTLHAANRPRRALSPELALAWRPERQLVIYE